jgi:hypothetical protein
MLSTSLSSEERSLVIRAFAIVPLALLPVGIVCWIIALVAPSNAFVGLTPWLVLSPLVAYPVAWLIGFPLWLAVRRVIVPTLPVCIAGGLLGAVVSGMLITLVIAPPHLSVLDIFVRNDVVAEATIFALLGAAYGALFWLLTYRRSRR